MWFARGMATTTMSRPKLRRLWTFNEMAAELAETNAPTELWDGEIIMSPAPKPSHQEVVFNLASLLKQFGSLILSLGPSRCLP